MYTAPEMIAATRSNPNSDALPCLPVYGPPADCWAYGLTAFKMLTGCSLFRPAEDPPDHDAGMDEDWDAWNTRYTADLHANWVRAKISLFSKDF
jgi:hypothetical protein